MRSALDGARYANHALPEKKVFQFFAVGIKNTGLLRFSTNNNKENVWVFLCIEFWLLTCDILLKPMSCYDRKFAFGFLTHIKKEHPSVYDTILYFF